MSKAVFQTMPGREFVLACADSFMHAMVVRISADYNGPGWTLSRNNVAFSEWALADEQNALRWFYPVLSSTRSPGEDRVFKTLDAAYAEAVRLAHSIGASLSFSVHARYYAHEHGAV